MTASFLPFSLYNMTAVLSVHGKLFGGGGECAGGKSHFILVADIDIVYIVEH
jgi:hypothetical protein